MVSNVTRAFLEIVEIFNENMEKKLWKRSKQMEYDTIHWIFITKYFGLDFQNFQNCGKSGHISGIICEKLVDHPTWKTFSPLTRSFQGKFS